ncbi:MAG: flagellar biosynthesis protein FlhB [Oscillospiraceae bacterium]
MAGDSKTEKATPKKRQDERKKGNVFQSKDIVLAISTIAVFLVLKISFPLIYKNVAAFLREVIELIGGINELSFETLKSLSTKAVVAGLISTAPVMVIAMLVGTLGSGIQTKFIVSFSSLKPKFSRINPFPGIKRMFSFNAIFELLKSILKVTIIIIILYKAFIDVSKEFPKLMQISIEAGVIFIFDSIMNMMFQIVLAFGILALFDFIYQWWSYENKMKMSKQDVKDEYKQSEGDPEVKGKIKQKQREISSKRMMQDVKTADVIVRNPTHFAIAIKYDQDKDIAPIVVAKGQDYLAMKIIKIAQENHIPMTENKPLARALFAMVEPPAPIPAEFYAVMAEIFAWVYNLKKEKMKG